VAEEFIPISMFVGLTVVISLFFWFRYRGRSDLQMTIRTAIEKGQELTPELIDRLGSPQPPKDKDLRLALISMSIALGISLFGFAMSFEDEQVFPIMLGIAAFPACVGIAYLIMWRFTERAQ
jgi:hypothetical protein